MSLGHIPRMAEVVTGWGDRLGFDVDVVVGVDGETGVPRPRDRGKRGGGLFEAVTAGYRHHLVEKQVCGKRGQLRLIMKLTL